MIRQLEDWLTKTENDGSRCTSAKARRSILRLAGVFAHAKSSMKTRLYPPLLLTVISCGLTSYAQTETYVIARVGIEDTVSTYHLLELRQKGGRWIFPDFVYIDFSKSDYREAWAGAGLKTLQAKHITLMTGGYFAAALGRAANGATYLLPWADASYQLTQRIGGDAYYLVYLPLNSAGTTQHVLERAKLERDFGHFKLGGGYAGYESPSTPWQNRPFVTTTFKAGRLGNIELWLQRLPLNNAQLQIRYVWAHRSS